MKKYLCVFTGSPTAMSEWDTLTESERQRRQAEGISAWKKWMETHASSIAETGGPLSKTKLVSKAGISDIRNSLAGFVIVTAKSQEAAAQLFIAHPHFTIFPGEGVEIMEVMPIPAG